MKTYFTVVLVLAAFCSASVHAAVLTLGADKDTSIFQNNVNNAGGGGPGLFAGTNGSNSPRRALISFDLSSIPAGSTITNVQLTLTLGQVAGMGPDTATIGLFALTRNWGEGAANSGVSGIGGSGNGAAAGTGDATWNAAMFPGTVWTTAGGDHAPAVSASLLLETRTLETRFTWLSTPQLIADTQGWLNNSATNFGWEIINAVESSASTVFGFYSSEQHTFPGGNADQEPVLQVTYTVPEPGTNILLVAAAGMWLAGRWRRAHACDGDPVLRLSGAASPACGSAMPFSTSSSMHAVQPCPRPAPALHCLGTAIKPP